MLQHFVQDECTYIASALAFTSLLALVPLMSVGLAIFSSFPVFQGFVKPLQEFIFSNFVPATGDIILNYLVQFTTQASKMSIFGILFLMCTALLMLFTIEQAMNKIWRVNSGRHGINAFLSYWAVLSLTPIMIGLSIAISSYLLSTPFFPTHPILTFLISHAPFTLSFTGFFFLYTVVPNCPIKIRYSLGGALIATLLFEGAKYSFAYYLTRYNPYELLYGAFAIVPIFFIWVYWVWIITLLGAEISYALSVHHQRREGTPLDGFSHALLWLNELWRNKDKGLNFNELIAISSKPFTVDVDDMIHTLTRSELIHCTHDGHYMINSNMSEITLYELSQRLPYRLPTYDELKSLATLEQHPSTRALQQGDETLQKVWNMNLDELFNAPFKNHGDRI